MKKKAKKTKFIIVNLLPSLTILISILVGNLPLHFESSVFFLPSLSFPFIYFWTNYNPHLLRAPTIMILGIIKDILENSLLGLNSLFFLIFQIIIFSQKKLLKKNNAFMLIWIEYIFCLSLIFLFSYALILMKINVINSPIIILFLQWLISSFAYVPIHWAMNLLIKFVK